MVHVAVLLLMWFWYGTVSAAALLSHELGESVWLSSGSLAWFSRGGGGRRERERRGGREREAVSSREEEERDCQEEVERERLYQEERYLFIQVRLRRASKRPKTLGHVLVAAGHSALFCFCFFFFL